MGIRKRSLNKMEGLRIKEVEKISDDNVLVKTKDLTFNIDEISEYKQNFEKLKNEGILTSDCNYEDRSWKGLGLHFYRTLNFGDYEYNNDIYQSLKAYAVTKLYHNRETIDSVSNGIRNIKNVLGRTKILDIRELDSFSEYMEGFADSSKGAIITDVLSYLLFNPLKNKDEFSEVLLNSDVYLGRVPRKIPPISSIIIFSEVLEEFFLNANDEEKIKYYPVYLWWKITSVIPLRPNEFIKIKKGCIDTEDNKYFLKLPRSKQEPNPLSKGCVVPPCDIVEINKELNDLISKYILLAGIDDEEYLIPLSVYSKFKKNVLVSEKLSIFKERIGYTQMSDLLEEFQMSIVGRKYKVINKDEYYGELEITELDDREDKVTKIKERLKSSSDVLGTNKFVRMTLGDTRHFAFCSLMLQGFNPLTIASIGGHTKLDSQMNYHNHLDVYLECHTYLLKNLIKHNINRKDINEYGKTSREISLMKFDKREVVRKVEGGFCCSKNFPKECVSVRCTRCSKYKVDFDNLNEYTKKQLEETLEEIKQEIKSKISFVKRYHSSNLEDLISDKNDEEIKKDAASLRKVVEEKARIEAVLDIIEGY